MKSAKNKIGQRAAEFVQDGDTIFVDASTTAEYLGGSVVETPSMLMGAEIIY